MKSADLTAARWVKSSHSTPERECVEVAFLPGTSVAVRDTKDHGIGETVLFVSSSWRAFVGAVAAG